MKTNNLESLLINPDPRNWDALRKIDKIIDDITDDIENDENPQLVNKYQITLVVGDRKKYEMQIIDQVTKMKDGECRMIPVACMKDTTLSEIGLILYLPATIQQVKLADTVVVVRGSSNKDDDTTDKVTDWIVDLARKWHKEIININIDQKKIIPTENNEITRERTPDEIIAALNNK